MQGQFTSNTAEQAARIIEAGRQLADYLRAEGLARLALDTPLVVRGVRKLGQGQALDRDLGPILAAMLTTVTRQRDAEIIARVPVFEGVRDPEGDDLGTVTERLILSDRGDAIQHVLAKIESVLRMRQNLFDRLEAERFAATARPNAS